MQVDVAAETKAWIAANGKGAAAELSFVKGKGQSATVDINGYEFVLTLADGTWAVQVADGDDEAEEGAGALVVHMIQFASARKRALAEMLREMQKVFPSLVDEGASDEEGGGGSGSDEEEKEYEKWVDEEPVKKTKKQPSDWVDANQFNFPSIAKGAATQRLIADFAALKGTDTKTMAGFEAAPHQGNLYCWRVNIYPPADSDLYKDLMVLAKKRKQDAFILLEMLFPCEYPNDPPFIRVLSPRFALRSGHVTIGGSICMDLLTNSGWSPVNSIESVIINIRTEMVHGGGRLDLSNTSEYTVEEAKAAFTRVATQHGWVVPPMQNLPWESATGK